MIRGRIRGHPPPPQAYGEVFLEGNFAPVAEERFNKDLEVCAHTRVCMCVCVCARTYACVCAWL
jgi:hypothetical protein